MELSLTKNINRFTYAGLDSWVLNKVSSTRESNLPQLPVKIKKCLMNDISILVLKAQELSPSSQKTDQTLQDSPGPANLLSHRLKLLNYSATRRPTMEDFLNSCQSAAKLVPTKTHTYKGNVTWLMEVGEGPTANLPRANTGALESMLEALESNPDPPKTT
ncbi:hypothetical protein DSO57_1005201 [Entomophthora muscae]|uniref:Uncharacterized protein n=1 Tax=Entomophthora muscae TaxID=34485 RepID=A0ACC2T7N3_9FUNG|nr:hypothetical protein DSO57_1005201 [Entomophthora muscae]